MRKYVVLGLLLTALAIPATAAAAYLHEPHTNSKCDVNGVTGWHFVNNQLNGATSGYLTAIFSTGTIYNEPGEKKGNNNGGTLHWTVYTPAGALLIDAYSDTTSSGMNPGPQVAGKLVLSDCFKK